MACELRYNDIGIETDLDHTTVQALIDELLKRRFFIKGITKKADVDSHRPNYFHVGYKGRMISVRIAQDIDKEWYCWIFSLKAFSRMQPPLFVID
ncbi:MAG: hypothetical protein GF350_14635 [Chitinivibrionales bacterium]|nr:hypothetical protein [Chitinivibrionales bacterium]